MIIFYKIGKGHLNENMSRNRVMLFSLFHASLILKQFTISSLQMNLGEKIDKLDGKLTIEYHSRYR